MAPGGAGRGKTWSPRQVGAGLTRPGAATSRRVPYARDRARSSTVPAPGPRGWSDPTTTRRRLEGRGDLSRRHPSFGRVSPQVGVLDERAMADLMVEEPEQGWALLADLTAAVDPALRALARRLAGRLAVRMAGGVDLQRRGGGRIAITAAGPDADVDLEASLPAVLEAGGAGRAPHADDLVGRGWRRAEPAVALLVDRSGSMGGERLAAAAVAAASVATRFPHRYSVLTFASEVTVLQAFGEPRRIELVIEDLLSLRASGTTDLRGALLEVSRLLHQVATGRRVVVVLSDCRHNAGGDPLEIARQLQADLAVLAPADDAHDAQRLARACGGQFTALRGVQSVPEALALVLR